MMVKAATDKSKSGSLCIVAVGASKMVQSPSENDTHAGRSRECNKPSFVGPAKLESHDGNFGGTVLPLPSGATLWLTLHQLTLGGRNHWKIASTFQLVFFQQSSVFVSEIEFS